MACRIALSRVHPSFFLSLCPLLRSLFVYLMLSDAETLQATVFLRFRLMPISPVAPSTIAVVIFE
jgi:hypothetical protein